MNAQPYLISLFTFGFCSQNKFYLIDKRKNMFYDPNHMKSAAKDILTTLKEFNLKHETIEDVLKTPRLKYALILKKHLVNLGMNIKRAEMVVSLSKIDIQPGVDEFVEEELRAIAEESAKTIFKMCEAIDKSFTNPDMVIQNMFKTEPPEFTFT